MSLIGACLAEEAHLPDLIAEPAHAQPEPGRQLLRDALVTARDRGEIDPDGDIEAAIETAIGAYYARYLAGRRLRRRLGGAGGRRHAARPGGPAPLGPHRRGPAALRRPRPS